MPRLPDDPHASRWCRDHGGRAEGCRAHPDCRRPLALVARLQRELGPRRLELLARRHERRAALAAGAELDYLPETAAVRAAEWQVAEAPADLLDRRVEITGPAEPKMLINALNSGARVFMADIEDALSPSWPNVLGAQTTLLDAVNRDVDFTSPEGKRYALDAETATLLVRHRGWHLEQAHVTVDGEPVSASLFDFGLHLANAGRAALERGSRTVPRPLLLPAQARVAPRGAALERRLRHGPGGPGHPGRDDPRHRPHRDHLGRLRDGGDPPRAARARRGPQRRSLGLHLQHHQGLPRAARQGPARPRAGDHGRALHARLCPVAGARLPSPRRARHRRHERLHPQPARAGGDGHGPGDACARTRSARQATASTARGWRIPTSCPWPARPSMPTSANGRTRRTGAARTP